jgi:hypothetical protein
MPHRRVDSFITLLRANTCARHTHENAWRDFISSAPRAAWQQMCPALHPRCARPTPHTTQRYTTQHYNERTTATKRHVPAVGHVSLASSGQPRTTHVIP